VAAVTVVVVVGCLADELGAVSQLKTIHARHAGRNFDVRREFSRMPSTEYRSCHPLPTQLRRGGAHT
jgi:hypothetical protein